MPADNQQERLPLVNEAGDVIGHAAQEEGRVYFETRENQRPIDPTSRLKA